MQPPISRDDSVVEFTLRAALAGIVFGVIFGAANAYLGLRVGLTVSTSIPIAVLTVALFRFLGRPGRGNVILEANMSQTIGSASSSLASGTIFTIPALFLWGMIPPYWQVVTLAFLGAVLGITAMIPLRRLLIVKAADELPYPEGTACAEVLRATSNASRGGRWIFLGLAVGAVIKLLLGALALIDSQLAMHVAVLPKAELALEVAPALLAVGYILGYRQSSIMVSGSLISALVLTPLIALVGQGLPSPLFPEATTLISDMTAGQIWSRYVRYIGAGAVAAAGIAAWETDLAELIVQLGHDRPSHILVPAIHRNRAEIRALFMRSLGLEELSDEPKALAGMSTPSSAARPLAGPILECAAVSDRMPRARAPSSTIPNGRAPIAMDSRPIERNVAMVLRTASPANFGRPVSIPAPASSSR